MKCPYTLAYIVFRVPILKDTYAKILRKSFLVIATIRKTILKSVRVNVRTQARTCANKLPKVSRMPIKRLALCNYSTQFCVAKNSLRIDPQDLRAATSVILVHKFILVLVFILFCKQSY